MRKEIQNHAGCHTKFFTQQEGFSKIAQVFAISDEDQFVDSSAFKHGANVRLVENSDQLNAPFAMALNRTSNFRSARAAANHGNMTDVQRSVFFEAKNGEPVRNQKEGVDAECQQHHNATLLIAFDEQKDRSHDETGKPDRFQQLFDLLG